METDSIYQKKAKKTQNPCTNLILTLAKCPTWFPMHIHNPENKDRNDWSQITRKKDFMTSTPTQMTDAYFDDDSFMGPIMTVVFSVAVHFSLVKMPTGITASRKDVYIFEPVAHLVWVSWRYFDIGITTCRWAEVLLERMGVPKLTYFRSTALMKSV